MQQVSFVNELTRSFYELPDHVAIAAIDKHTLDFCCPTSEDQDTLLNHHLPRMVKLAADLDCSKIQVRCLNDPPDKLLRFEAENLKRFIDRLKLPNNK
jgi:hypothetical protein